MLKLQPSTSVERKLLFEETLINLSDKISKISDNSVFAGTAGGVAKIAGKAEKDIALALSQLFPDSSFAEYLDQAFSNLGVYPRLGATGSSTYVRVVGTPGTSYVAATSFPSSTTGIQFQFQNDFVIPSFGYCYQPVASLSTGTNTNVGPLTISLLNSPPNGHLYLINENAATLGRDAETDDAFKARGKEGSNILASSTLSQLEQLLISVNNRVLKVYKQGADINGNCILALSSVNGVDFNNTELNQMLTACQTSVALTDLKPYGINYYGIVLQNIEYSPIDISFRCTINSSANPDDVRINIQAAFAKYFDYNSIDLSQPIQWVNLFNIVKNTKGIDYLSDTYFFPKTDFSLDQSKLPRIRSFLILDLQGNIVQNFSGSLNPIFYLNFVDLSFTSSVLRTL